MFQLLVVASTFTTGANGNSVKTNIESCGPITGSKQEDVCDLPDDARVASTDSKWCCDVDNWSSWDKCADLDGKTDCKNDIKGRDLRTDQTLLFITLIVKQFH